MRSLKHTVVTLVGLIHFACGDPKPSTNLQAGRGLEKQGGVLYLHPSYALPQICEGGDGLDWSDYSSTWTCKKPFKCSTGEIPIWKVDRWVCAPSISVGAGLVEDPNVPGGIALDERFLESRWRAQAPGVVQIGGGLEPKENGQALVTAIEEAFRSPPFPSVVRLGPGTFEFEKRIVFPSSVSIEGAGAYHTSLLFRDGGLTVGPSSLVRGLKLERSGGSDEKFLVAQGEVHIDGVELKLSGDNDLRIVGVLISEAENASKIDRTSVVINGYKFADGIQIDSSGGLVVRDSDVFILASDGTAIRSSSGPLDVNGVRVHLLEAGKSNYLIGIASHTKLALKNSDVVIDGSGIGASGFGAELSEITSSTILVSGEGTGLSGGGSSNMDGMRIDILASRIEARNGRAITVGGDVSCKIDSSTIIGRDAIKALEIDRSSLRVGASKLSGGLVNVPDARCVHSYDEDLVPLSGDCRQMPAQED
ncbi:MAG TPA: hypothetical protein VN033_10180 [Vulgatibacter sp.]|nr:hypothetical protein [Vulgatibacter sp.]